MNYDKLTASCCVFNSDEDQPIVEDLTIGYDEVAFDLIVLLEHTDYEEPEYNCATWAAVGKDEAYVLSRRMKVPMRELPSLISRRMSEWREIVNPSLSDVRGCFQEILELLSDRRCRYRIKRSYGKYGYTCG